MNVRRGRLNNEGFIAMMKRVKISLLAVDESHCISQVCATHTHNVTRPRLMSATVGRKLPTGVLEDSPFRRGDGRRARPLSDGNCHRVRCQGRLRQLFHPSERGRVPYPCLSAEVRDSCSPAAFA